MFSLTVIYWLGQLSPNINLYPLKHVLQTCENPGEQDSKVKSKMFKIFFFFMICISTDTYIVKYVVKIVGKIDCLQIVLGPINWEAKNRKYAYNIVFVFWSQLLCYLSNFFLGRRTTVWLRSLLQGQKFQSLTHDSNLLCSCHSGGSNIQ